MKLASITTQTPVGPFHLIVDRVKNKMGDIDVVYLSGFRELSDVKKRMSKELQQFDIEEIKGKHMYKKVVEAYFDGDSKALASIPHKQEGSEFNHNVWKAISEVKPGSTVSYKELALAAKNQRAVRAAATICGKNRLILLVPCHRVIKSDGAVGSYLYGSKIKNFLLKLEKNAKAQ